jgi:hypothetical protein
METLLNPTSTWLTIAGLDEPLIQLFHGLDIHELNKLKFYQNYDEVNR